MLIRYPHRATVNNKRLISKRKKTREKICIMALLRITKGNNSNSNGPSYKGISCILWDFKTYAWGCCCGLGLGQRGCTLGHPR